MMRAFWGSLGRVRQGREVSVHTKSFPHLSNRPAALVLTATALAAWACRDEPPATDIAEERLDFAYGGVTGPTHWAELDPAFSTCAAGAHQSPIDLSAKDAGPRDGFSVDYQPAQLTLLNNGHTVQAAIMGGGRLVLDGVPYTLKQMHVHAHSEHTVNGVETPLELHFVNQSATGGIAVVGVLVQEGDENDALASFIEHAPAAPTEAADVPATVIDPAAILPPEPWMWHYTGSLTTPPCSEGVQWNVFFEPIEASAAQIEKLTAIVHGNARPLQVNGSARPRAL